MRVAILTLALLFTAMLAVLTGIDFARHGVTVIGALAVFILVVFITGIVGALRNPPRE